MSLAKAEKMFWEIVDSDDPELAELLAEWCPWYLSPRYSDYKEGEPVRAAFREYGYKPTTNVTLSHARVVSLAREAAGNADVKAAASAFILSASPDPWRARFQNPLRAVSIIRNIPRHRFQGSLGCHVCGVEKQSSWAPIDAAQHFFPGGYTGEDWEIFENLMVVRWFAQAACPRPHAKDVTAFRRVLKIINAAPPTATCPKIATMLKKQLKGHIDPWRYFFETLGYSGVLKTDVQPGNLQVWTNACDRQYRSVENPTPSCHWRRWMGFDCDVFDDLFPQISMPSGLRPKAGKP